jgi:nucleoside-diphosphate-sugar epimerase
MRVLFIGGTGNISADCSRELLRDPWISLSHANRGNRSTIDGVVQATVDWWNDDEAVEKLLSENRFDAVVNFIVFTPEQAQRDIDRFSRHFADRFGQYIFISSASAYHKPVRRLPIHESTPLHNPFWGYSRAKIACEERYIAAYRATGFPITIVRPSHTYSDGWLPTTFSHDFTVAQRMLDGKPIVVHGDGTSLWTLTHTTDFARAFRYLVGNPSVVGDTFHITSDEALPWNEIHETIAAALGVKPDIRHVASERIASVDPTLEGPLLGDKAHTVVFDNTKIREVAPGWQPQIRFYQGVLRSLRHLGENPSQRVVNAENELLIERLLNV